MVYLDQETGRCLVYSSQGKLLADLKIPQNGRHPLPGMRLTNKRGDIQLERLQVSRWTGAPPAATWRSTSRGFTSRTAPSSTASLSGTTRPPRPSWCAAQRI